MKKSLLFLFLVLTFSQSKSQSTLVLNVDSFYQPTQVLDISNVDTLIVNNFLSIINYVKPLSLNFDSASWFNPLNISGNICDFSVDSTSFDCRLFADTIIYTGPNSAFHKFYNIPDCRTFVVTHQYNPLYFILHKQKDCILNSKETITDSENSISFFPNPSSGDLNIRINTPGKYSLRVSNALGQQIAFKNLLSGVQEIDISANELKTGIYFLEVFDQHQTRLKVEKWMVNGF